MMTCNTLCILGLILVSFQCLAQAHMPVDPNAVFTVSHTRYFRKDLIDKSMGNGVKAAYTSYTYPDGISDALHIITNPGNFGGKRNSKQTFAKVFGWDQDYEQMISKTARVVAPHVQSAVRTHNIIIDWKKYGGDLSQARSFLDALIAEMKQSEVFLKVPGSYLCKIVNGSPYILGLTNVKNIIVEMYGEQPQAYKTSEQIFTAESNIGPTNEAYPSPSCPQFPSYTMLTKAYPNINFFIEKTLQSHEPGYLGMQFDSILSQGRSLYGTTKNIFYDSYPYNLLSI